jgi:hypothetical protein
VHHGVGDLSISVLNNSLLPPILTWRPYRYKNDTTSLRILAFCTVIKMVRKIYDFYKDNSSIVVCAFVAAVMFLPSHWLATIGGIHIETRRLMGGIYEVDR